MKQQLPKKWARRIFAIRLGATLLGAGVLVALLALLALLYWMNATAPMSSPAKMLARDSPAWLLFARFSPWPASAPGVPKDVLAAARDGLPQGVANVVEKGLRNPSCPAELVFSLSAQGEKVTAISLGKYPGLFRVVCRDLERRTAKGLLPYALKYHAETTMFFVDNAASDGLKPFAIRGTTVICASSNAALEDMLNWMDEPIANNYRDYLDEPSFELLAKSWPMLTQLVGDVAPDWGEAVRRMGNELPSLDRLTRILLSYRYRTGGCHLGVLASTAEDAAQLAEGVPAWFRANPGIGPVRLTAGKVSVGSQRGAGVNANVKTFNVEIDLAMVLDAVPPVTDAK